MRVVDGFWGMYIFVHVIRKLKSKVALLRKAPTKKFFGDNSIFLKALSRFGAI